MFEGLLDLGWLPLVILGLSLLVALGFEFVNGFHDTANAVATVIYTNSLPPNRAVLLSGICNFCGVFVGGIAVAMAIIHLLPVELLVSGGTGAGLAMVMALLVAAILWNLGTWYLGLPASSSHTLIGAILGVGLANSLLPGHVFGSGVNWGKAEHVGLSLLVSPLFGCALAGLLLLGARRVFRDPALYEAPLEDTPPPTWIRGTLIATCCGVSFAHGSNDGQKGIGLIMLILIGVLPANFALNLAAAPETIRATVAASEAFEARILGAGIADVSTADLVTIDRELLPTGGEAHPEGVPAHAKVPKTAAGAARMALFHLERMRLLLDGVERVPDLPRGERWSVRESGLRFEQAYKALLAQGALKEGPEAQQDLQALRALTEYAPTFVLVLVALALGVGTMIGWKRIVVTVGEKIGESHLTYAQGACAEIVAMSTVGAAAFAGLPVSTTHVLSSGIAGTMLANKSGLQSGTVKKIAMAWVLTLPAAMLMSGLLYLLFRLFV
ncbi:MAG: inorganic phosphate transporter [Planctomycetes bacterium]|nr:inorganic phosphate transporter [Planctomycetota bacterium]